MKKIEFKSFLEKAPKGKLNKQKIKQISLSLIAFILFSVGFINYKSENIESENEDMIGDVELVSSGSIVNNDTTLGALVENEDVVEEVYSKSDNSNYFENMRIERDCMYSRMLETYHKMLDNENLTEEQKMIAVKEIEKITNNQNAIMIAENLIKNKGFEEAVVLANTDIINVIVKSAVLSNEDIGKIQNIIEREFNVSLENVNISNKN